MTVSKIDEMIARVRHDHLSQRQAQQQELEDRRNAALTRIGNAVIDHGLLFGQSVDVEQTLKNRLRQAEHARISEAEAMADLAEFDGDLVSDLCWWELKNSDETVLWKGYVVDERLARVRFDALSAVDINVRRACTGEIVAALYVEDKGNRSVGVSYGEHASVREAVINAYEIWQKLDGPVGDTEVPSELLIAIDRDNGCGITNLRSFDDVDAQDARREPDGGQYGNDV